MEDKKLNNWKPTRAQFYGLVRLADGETMRHSLMSGWTVPAYDPAIRVRCMNDEEAGELADMGLISTQDSGPQAHTYTISNKGRLAIEQLTSQHDSTVIAR